MKAKSLNSRFLFGIFIALGFGLYSPALNGEFVSDDLLYIVNNHAVYNVSNLAGLWQSFNTRFILGITFALNYTLGGLNPFGYHVFNIVVHGVVSFLVYYFIRLTFTTPALTKHPLKKYAQRIALTASLIFLVHPLQSQAVAFISQRGTSMATALYLTGLIGYIKFRLNGNKGFLWLAGIAMAIGVFTKEMVITLPVAIIVYESYFLSSFAEAKIKHFKPIGIFFAIGCLLPMILLLDRPGSALGLKSQVLSRGISLKYFLTEINVLRTYLRLVIWPVNLQHIYDYPIVERLFEFRTIVSVLILGGLGTLAYKKRSKSPIFSFCIVWFFLTTSVEALVVSVANREVIFEHWMYLPMVGCSVILALTIIHIAKDEAGRRGLTVFLLIVFSLMTYLRAGTWSTEIGFWKDNMYKAPNKAYANFGLADAYFRRGDYARAEEYLEKTLSLDPGFLRAHNNLGIIKYLTEDKKKAIAIFNRVIALDKANAKAYNNLGYVYFLEGDFKKSLKYYNESLRIQGDYPDAFFYMGQGLFNLGDKGKAKELLLKAAEMYQTYKQTQKAKEVQAFIKANF